MFKTNLLLVAVMACMVSLLQAEDFNVAGLKFQTPKTWKSVAPASSMRVAQWSVGSSQPADVAVFYFGQGEGGSVDANIARWIGQVKTVEGKPVQAQPVVSKVGDERITQVSAFGTFDAGMSAAPNSKPHEDYGLCGAIVEGPAGNIFIKMTGPAKTVRENKTIFEAFVNSVSRAPRCSTK